ncbi:histidine triad nucleotide-binding protein [Buchnera aphidicola (Chaitoregma tattakana)]|uniref:histidine triad nucleotide-binding protein n=1 Tax=Buchnera aphidicola TaxID=9 RepID=UPI0031B82D1F
MNYENIFIKIIKREIPSEIIYQDKQVTAFKDINPQSPIHILIIPNKKIRSTNKINKKNKNIIGNMIYIAVKIAKKFHFHKDGYRIVINCNKNGGQTIPHLHMHLLAGKILGKFN